jgi:DMSO/TMAO reductase YedYZ molybdopterin-dependent catalytic subunit
MTSSPAPPTDDVATTASGTPLPPVSRPLAALSGVLAAAAGLGVGELVAALVTSWPSPVIAIGDRVIERAPQPVTRFAIDTFGTADKPVLIAGTLVLLAVAAAGLGVLALRRPAAALLGVAALGAVGGAATLASPGTGVAALLPAAATTVVAGVALLVLISGLAGRAAVAQPAPVGGALGAVSRRRFLTLASTVAAGAAATATAGRFLVGSFDVDAARAALSLPAPSRTQDLPLPDDATFDVEGLTPYVTSNEDFYRIDINLELPRVDPETHVLRIHGMVDRELRIPFTDLLRRDLVEIPLTMTCVSNEVGGQLVGNALWLGVPLRELLDEAGVDPDADQIVGRSVDGYTGGFPVEAAYDRDAMVVVGMNGEPLPLEHGFPLRLITPGIYGYVGSTKWLGEIEVTRFDAFDQYWVPRGYAAQAPIKTQSRIDTPRGLATVDPGTVPIAGVAWAQTRGVSRVEVRVDDGDWQEAELAPAVGEATWIPWRLPYEATPGRHSVTVRATDGDGEVQTEERTSVAPDGASGWHSVVFTVRDA